eukprot:126035-Alexandrium_andersonii.AAC.1
MSETERLALLEKSVGECPVVLGTVDSDQKRRQRILYPMRDVRGNLHHRDVYVPTEPDPQFPN